MNATDPYGAGNLVLREFRNEPTTDFSRRTEREDFLRALKAARSTFPADVPLVIGGERVSTPDQIDSFDPSQTDRLVARSASATEKHVDEAVAIARKSYEQWSRTPVHLRAEVLLGAARHLREEKHFLSAIQVYEAGKPWREAVADIDEAIDFIEYYSREAMRLAEPQRLQPYLLGEHNDLTYHPLGVVGVIGPWNFPMAIPVGMSSAALAAGNAILLKPAEQTPLIASFFITALEKAGLPPGVVGFLPGKGEVCGARLVQHPLVNMIVFTGSRDVGLMIAREAARTHEGQPFVKRVVVEMGGKNAIIVDSSADLDSSVPDTLYSAFGFSGQKCSACSRLIIVKDAYRECVKRLKEGIEALKIGAAENPGTQVGPVIDGDAVEKIGSYIDLGKNTARHLYSADIGNLASSGNFVPPSLFEVDSETHRLMQEEIFGPVLTVMEARDFEEALRIANSTHYALTGGVHSRTLSNLERARTEFQVGNLYLNRTITGAIVGRQPFGGYRLSGIGSKAGGPDYLKQFTVARVVSTNMMRHGMASLKEMP